MYHRVASRLRRAATLPLLALSLALPACSGGGDATGPTPEAPHQPPPPPPPPPAPEIPEPPQPVIAGTYRLVLINESQPGQMVSIANPDGILIGLYRFQESTTLALSPMQTWTLEIHYSDDKSGYLIADHGEFAWSGDDSGVALTFESAAFGDVFAGKGRDGVIAIRYDMDGDGRLDTTFGFEQVD